MHEARLWKPLSGGKVHCRLCAHYCVIDDGGRGRCGVRENHGGRLETQVYGRVAALNLDPVEKKPLFHYKPGATTLSFATMGCNLACSFCQNHTLSQPPRAGRPAQGRDTTPEQLVRTALDDGAESISYTYSEPTVFFEFMQDTARAAHEAGLGNIMVSNGFQSPECLEALDGLIDAANIDLKAFTEDFYRDRCGARLAPVLENLKAIKTMGWWLEVTTLVIPGLNDSEGELADMAGFLARELGSDTPWHVSRFHPDYTLTDRGPTPVATLETAYRLGREAGLDYVYTGNVPGHDGENTRCPSCGEVVIRRRGFSILGADLKAGACASCGATVAGIDMG